MKCAVVNEQNIVVNMIVADPMVDIAPVGCTLHAVASDVWIDIGMNWDDRIVVVPQDPPPEESV